MKVFALETERLAWEEADAAGISEKVLKQDADTGARTLLLRSSPRPAAAMLDRRPQHHSVDEEFLCLAGKFTLEGTHWLTPMTYVYYPAGLVHGFGVNVPDGYQVYLRNSGPLIPERVDSPAQDSPYFIGARSPDCSHAIVSYCSELIRDALQASQLSIITLRKDDRTKEGALIVCMPPDRHLEFRLDGSGGYAEFFVLEGEIQLGDLKPIGKWSYASLVGPADLRITSVGSITMLLHYCDGRIASDIARQAESLHHAVNSQPQN